MKRILVVDDDMDTAELIKITLEDKGYKVETALTGNECLKKLEKDGFNLVTLDIIMPEKDGWEILKSIREDERLKDMPVIVFTVRDTEKDYEKAKELGANGFLTKSSDGDRLVEKVEEVLA